MAVVRGMGHMNFANEQLCTRATITPAIQTDSLKYKLIGCINTALYFIALTFFYFSAVNSRYEVTMNINILRVIMTSLLPSKRYCIARRARTLLGLQLHYVYAVCLTFCPGAVNQLNNMVLERAHPWLGPDTAFSVWMLEFMLENLGS